MEQETPQEENSSAEGSGWNISPDNMNDDDTVATDVLSSGEDDAARYSSGEASATVLINESAIPQENEVAVLDDSDVENGFESYDDGDEGTALLSEFDSDVDFNRPTVAEIAPVKVKKKAMNLPLSVVIFILFGILIFSASTVSIIAFVAQSTLSNGSLATSVDDMEISDLTVEELIPEEQLKSINEEYDADIDSDYTIFETVSQLVDDDRFTPEVIEEIYNSSEFGDYIEKYVTSYSDYLLTGESEDVMSVNEIVDLIEESRDVIEEETGYMVSDDDLVVIKDQLKENKEIIEAIAPEEALGDVAAPIRYAISPLASIALAVLALIFFLLEMLLTRRVRGAFLAGGISIALSGVAILGATLLRSSFLSSILPSEKVMEIVNEILDGSLVPDLLVAGVIALSIGLVLVLVHLIMTLVAKKSA